MKTRIIRDPEHSWLQSFHTVVCKCGEQFVATSVVGAWDEFGEHEDLTANEYLSRVVPNGGKK